MGFKCGIIGLPNVGKSTLFNALTRTASAQAANYPFCTIEPNSGEVAVPDPRMKKLAEIAKSKDLIPARMSFVDIAGIVRGASKGEGLGNQFLANIREVDAIVHVLRCFEDENIIHVEGKIDPINDIETIETELMLSDLERLEKIFEKNKKLKNNKSKENVLTQEIVSQSLSLIEKGQPVRSLLNNLDPDSKQIFKSLNLLTSKPVLYVCNVSENDCLIGNENTNAVKKIAEKQNAETIIISAAIEAEIAQLPEEEASIFMKDLGISISGLESLINYGYRLLNLITYFTVGEKETHAWTIPCGMNAQKAAGIIHSDFEKGFIRALTISYDDYIMMGGENAAKEAGKARDEGKDYIVKDGDIMHFRFNV
ncbi:redox-regulated ATPase YchF [Candidatus Liberibacter americanus]|uniref:Ribosome-binding ATPase YchF n=1 Tax=Candidatus Liberibacter americanus str. Sao Paulo TaxID=1261131 RepID=U6B8Z6_9HYPH|nr:redox-regulated ATPase YchF [Candidatus Liberibacter americanus]AHA28187.1 putative GTPase [Candidatus Liberibacter americanus str. Sao Paulo]EMS36296.1 translation-associated GTPase [Candidatus Liberibacter americanus PW_SP]